MPGHNSRPTVANLVTEGLGYCCTWFFFKHFRQTPLVAARLGVTDRAVRMAKARVDSGEDACKHCDKCLHARITLEGSPRVKSFDSSPPKNSSTK